MAGEYDGSEPLKSLGGDLVPQVWDPTLNGGNGGWRVIEPPDLGGAAPLAAPSSNIVRTSVAFDSAQHQVASGACTYGFYLANDPDSADRLYYGKTGVDATHGDVLEPGERIWLPVSDSGAIYVMAAAASCFYRGVRY
jgi:hypothetical protein